MINPRSLIRALDKHWEAIERIVALGQEQIAYERDELLALLEKVYVHESGEQRLERLQQMVNTELLIPMSHSNMLQLNDTVRQFVGSLLHEHELGLSDILKARIVDIKDGLEQLHRALDEHDMAALQRGAVRIDNQLRQILQQLDQDSHAIQAIAERAKSADGRLRAFGNYSVRLADPRVFHTEISGTRAAYTVADLDGQLRGVLLQHLSDAVAGSGIPFLDLAANQIAFAKAIMAAVAPSFEAMGLQLETLTVQNVSLPEELQKVLDQKIGMGMVGQNMGQFMQYQAAQALPTLASASGQGGGVVADAASLGAGLALGQVMAQTIQQGLQPPSPAVAPVSVDEVMATLEKLGELKAKGILTDEEFSAKKAELLKKIS